MDDVVKADPGEGFDIAAGRAIKTAKEKGSGVFLEFNDTRVWVSPGSLAGTSGRSIISRENSGDVLPTDDFLRTLVFCGGRLKEKSFWEERKGRYE